MPFQIQIISASPHADEYRKKPTAARPGPSLQITTYHHDCPQAVLFVASVVQIRSMILQWAQEVIDEK